MRVYRGFTGSHVGEVREGSGENQPSTCFETNIINIGKRLACIPKCRSIFPLLGSTRLLPFLAGLIFLLTTGCRVTNRTVERQSFIQDYGKIKKNTQLTRFQDSVMRDLGYLSISTDRYLHALRPGNRDTTRMDPDNFVSSKYFEDLKMKNVSYSKLLAEIRGYETALAKAKANTLKVGAEIERRCLLYQKDVEASLDSVSRLFHYRLTALEQRDSSTIFTIVITRRNNFKIADLSINVLFFASNSKMLLFDFPLERKGSIQDSVMISKTLSKKDFSNPSYDYFRSILDGKDYEMKFMVHKMTFENKPYISPYNFYYHRLKSFLWGDGECPYFSEVETKKLTKSFQKYVREEGALIENYPILYGKQKISRKEFARMFNGR